MVYPFFIFGREPTMPRKRVIRRTMHFVTFDVLCADLLNESTEHINVSIPKAVYDSHLGLTQFYKWVKNKNLKPLKYKKLYDEVVVYEMPESQYMAEAKEVYRGKA